MAMKLCKECRWFRPGARYGVGFLGMKTVYDNCETARCACPTMDRNQAQAAVCGEVHDPQEICSVQRNPQLTSVECGYEGKLWEPRP